MSTPNDPPFLVPAHPRIVEANALHLAQLDRDLRPTAEAFLERCAALGHLLAIVQSRRSDADQFALFVKGRKRVGREWVVVDPKLIVTNARTARASAHGCICGIMHAKDDGCAFAVDVAFLVGGQLVGPRPGKGNDSWDEDLPWREIAIIGRDEFGLLPGASFGESQPGALDGWDKGHFELPGWRELRPGRVAQRHRALGIG